METVEGYPLLLKCIVGSQAYGTNLPDSDIDIKGVYIQPNEDILGFGYREQINVNKDETYYELRRFIELLASANPNILELLAMPEDCILYRHPVMDMIFPEEFLTIKARDSFGGYAVAQIKKAKGLDKKQNWEKSRVTRRGPLDFCYELHENSSGDMYTVPLGFGTREGLLSGQFGLVGLNHFPNCYQLVSAGIDELYHSVVCPESNELRTVSTPAGNGLGTFIHWNKDAYSQHCKDYREYQQWLEARNELRYVETQEHGQKIDGKNMMHCIRLIRMAQEILKGQGIIVRRPDADELIAIRKGNVNLEELIAEAEEAISMLDGLAVANDAMLPGLVSKRQTDQLLIAMRKAFWQLHNDETGEDSKAE